MKIIFYIFLAFVFAGSVYPQDSDPQSVYYAPPLVMRTQQNFLDYALFTNINLTVNAFPQNEPTVRILRTNPNIVVAAWRDFRLGYEPAIRRIGYTYSTNGGQSWAAPLMLPDPMPGHATQSDPVLTNDANGIIYLTSTSRDPSNVTGQTVVYRSTNNGVTFTELTTAAASSSFEDKEWITCDLTPASPNFNNLYITWTRIGSGIRFIKSTNGGVNWSTPVNVGDNTAGQGSNVSCGTNGYIYVVWGNSNGIKFDKSTNAGASFGTDVSLSTNNNQIGFPYLAVDYSNRATRGNLYVVWDDNRSGNYDVWFQRSTNSGANWLAAPIRLNDFATNDQYKAYIACDTNGTLSVIYYDERTTAGQVNAYYAYSTDAGSTWVNQRLSDSSFVLNAINADVRNGEYIGIDAYAGKIIPVWTDDRSGSPNQEIYTSNNIVVAAQNVSSEVPGSFALQQNYPNPFNPATTIEYSVPFASYISLEVFDILGSKVASLAAGKKERGNYSVKFDAAKLTSGIYFYTLSGDGFRETKKMILIK